MRQYLEKKYKEKVRVRVNTKNSGASYSRNRGIAESSADWILYLDNDVKVPRDILHHYAYAIEKDGGLYSGFVMPTKMPRIETVWSGGVAIMHLLYFWSEHIHSHRYVRWGVTAQICLLRGKERFNLAFPKTGGGEDIDLCLEVQRNNGGKPIGTILLSTPEQNISTEMKETAEYKHWVEHSFGRYCEHPWWNGGYVRSSRFYGWAYGDSLLMELHPEHTYMSFPNVVECTLFITIQAALRFPYQNSILESIIVLETLWSTQILFDVASAITSDAAPSVKGIARVAAAVVGSVYYKNLGTELGHLVGPVCRGHFLILHRFDWFCGQSPSKMTEARIKEGIPFAAFLFMTMFATMFGIFGAIALLLYGIGVFSLVLCSIIYAYTHKI